MSSDRHGTLISVNARATLILASFGLLPACTETPLDATLLQTDDTPIVTDVPDCVSQQPELDHVYAISSKPTGHCLSSGEVTQIKGTPAATGYTVELEPCTGGSDQQWLLHGTLAQMQIEHVDLNLNLDLEAAAINDGTEVLLFEPHGGRNQQFWLSPIGTDDSKEIRAVATDNGCLQAQILATEENAVELYGCPNVATVISPYQHWFFSEVDCEN